MSRGNFSSTDVSLGEGRKITGDKKEIHAHGNVFQILHLSFKENKTAFIYSYHFYTTVNKNIP